MDGYADGARIAFWGLEGAFDYHRVGGMDALARRLGSALAARGAAVTFVHFGGQERTEETGDGIALRYCATFAGGLAALAAEGCDHVVTFYVPPRHRAAYARFRRRQGRRTRFHLLQAGWRASRLRRSLALLDARLAPYNGCLFCLSPRLQRAAAQWCARAVLLLPPVPGDYCLDPRGKPAHDRMRVAYVGRVDPGKGTQAALVLFRRLERAGGFETCIYGYPWRHSCEGMRLHQELMAQDEVAYVPAEYEQHEAAEVGLRAALRETDVLYLPYARLNSTIDTPLVLLEGMAHLCGVVTRPLGSLPEVYGTARWMVDDLSDLGRVEHVLHALAGGLGEERVRLAGRVRELGCDTQSVAERLWRAMAS